MEFYDKRYQLLKEAVPKVAKLGILISRVFLEKTADGAAVREAARRAGIEPYCPPSKRLTGERTSIGLRSREWQKKASTGSSWLQWSKIGHTAD